MRNVMDGTIILKASLMMLVFLFFSVMMMLKKIPTILALPIMAILFAVIAGVPFISSDAETVTISKTILTDGAFRMASGMGGLIFGSWFGQVLTKVGITSSIIKKAAELAGDKPLPLALAFLIASTIVFSATNGLGVIILVGSIIIPIMITVGISPYVAGLIILFANAISVNFNVASWGIYLDVFGMDIATLSKYSVILSIPVAIAAIVLIVYEIVFSDKKRRAWAMPIDQKEEKKDINLLAYLSPLVPVALVFIFKIEIIPAVMIGSIYALITSLCKKPIHILSSSLIDGMKETAGAMCLLIGIGMLLNSVLSPQVSAVLSPFIDKIVPTTALGIVIVFTILSPLSVYRGPLNMFGLGSGIATLFVASGMNPITAMVALRSIGNLQSVCDPTNSHNAWVSDYTKTDVNDFLRKPIIVMIVVVLACMCIGVPMSMK